MGRQAPSLFDPRRGGRCNGMRATNPPTCTKSRWPRAAPRPEQRPDRNRPHAVLPELRRQGGTDQRPPRHGLPVLRHARGHRYRHHAVSGSRRACCPSSSPRRRRNPRWRTGSGACGSRPRGPPMPAAAKNEQIHSPFWTNRHDLAYGGARATGITPNRLGHREISGTPAAGRRTGAAHALDNVSGRSREFRRYCWFLPPARCRRCITDALTPWDPVASDAYQPEYLAGFLAEGTADPLAPAMTSHVRKWPGSSPWMDAATSAATNSDRHPDPHAGRDLQSISCCRSGPPPIAITAKSYRFVVNSQSGQCRRTAMVGLEDRFRHPRRASPGSPRWSR